MEGSNQGLEDLLAFIDDPTPQIRKLKRKIRELKK